MRLPQSRFCSTFLLASLFLILFSTAPLLASDAPAQPANLIINNARIYTVNPKQKWAEAIAVRGDKIIAVGDRKQIEALRGPATKEIDAQGRLLLPGFTDCHIHFMDGSLGLTRVDLNGATTVAEIQKRVKAYADAHPAQPATQPNDAWIQGMGWTYPTLAPSGLPTKKILDDVVPDRPVYLIAFDGHSSWANSKALATAGIDRNTPDPPNGKILPDQKRDPTCAATQPARHLVGPQTPLP